MVENTCHCEGNGCTFASGTCPSGHDGNRPRAGGRGRERKEGPWHRIPAPRSGASSGIEVEDAIHGEHRWHPNALGVSGVLFCCVTGAAPIAAMLFNVR
jgi:hypothetical protein